LQASSGKRGEVAREFSGEGISSENIRLLCLLLSVFFLVGRASTIEAGAVKPDSITIYAEAYPPLNFAEKGKLTGLATEVCECS
jgi:hypothetical protein